MASLNKCFFIGNLTRDPEVKYTAKGTAVASFGLAMNRQWKTEAGEKQEEVTFVDLTAWGQTAELIEKYLFKGSLAHFECRAKLDQWEDKQSGQKRQKIGFVVEQVIFLGSKKEAHEDASEEPPSRGSRRPSPAPERPPAGRRPLPKDPDLDAPEEDDIPFKSILAFAKRLIGRIYCPAKLLSPN